MSQVLTSLLYVVGVAGMFLILIAPHEAGHFLVAKLFKVRVIEFSIGAGTKLWSITRGGTLYAIRAVPVIGYVRMGGMESGDFNEADGFHSKSPLKRIAILAAGPAANFLVAMLLVIGFGLTQLNSDPGRIVQVLPGTPADAAGLKGGDQIRTINGLTVTAPGLIRQAESASPGSQMTLTGVHADGSPFTTRVFPICDADSNCQMGIRIAAVVSPQAAVTDGVAFPFVAMGGIFQGLGSLVSGQVKGGLLGPDGLTGPIGIAKITASAVDQGPPTYLSLVALLSVALGVTNLLPLLALDGGRIVVVIIEWIRRRPFNRESELNFQRWGLVALLALAAVISFLDIQRIATGQFPGVH
jgi:regulator of sigma E protease